MTFTVTYRGADGAVRTEAVEAASRGECFAQMKAKGITPTGVKEGNLVPRRGRRGDGNGGRAKRVAAGVRIPRDRIVYALLIAFIVLVGGGVVWWWFGHAGRVTLPEDDVLKKPSALAKEFEVAKPPVETKPDPNARPTKVGEVVNGYVMLPSGRIHRRQGVITNSLASRPKGAYHIFTHGCDNEIACYLSMKPGDALVGTPRYTGKFKERFLESLKTPIIVTQDDTPEQAQLKRDVIAAKIKLKDALDRGEDIEQIMLDTRKELQDLAQYKMELRSLFNEMRKKDCKTDEDVDNLLESCNKMLEAKGIAPMKFGPITRRKLMSEQKAMSEQEKQQ